MRKQKQPKHPPEAPGKNPVAKFAHLFNKSRVFGDKRKYQRKNKHPALEPFSITARVAIEKGFMAFAFHTVPKGFPTL